MKVEDFIYKNIAKLLKEAERNLKQSIKAKL